MSTSIERQEWLEKAVVMFRNHFSSNWWTVPDNVRISVGFPVGQREAKKILGQCHNQANSMDEHWELFISPEYTDTTEILETIAHELVHATVAIGGHRGKFKVCALAIGFESPMTVTPAGPKMKECVANIMQQIGEFPAGSLAWSKNRKKQKTNMKKMECACCGYIAYATMKWINSAGETVCPLDKVQMVCE